MLLNEAHERKEQLENVFEELQSSLDHIRTGQGARDIFIKMEACLEGFLSLNSKIIKTESTTYVSKTETISDVLLYIDGLYKRIGALKKILNVKCFADLSEESFPIDTTYIVDSIESYREVLRSLETKVEEYRKTTLLT